MGYIEQHDCSLKMSYSRNKKAQEQKKSMFSDDLHVYLYIYIAIYSVINPCTVKGKVK